MGPRRASSATNCSARQSRAESSVPSAPPFSALFLLLEPAVGRAFRGVVDDLDTDTVEADDFDRLAKAVTDDDPLIVRHVGGSEPRDFIWTDEGVTCISDRVVRTLRVNAVTGWETFAVRVSTKAGRTLHGYAGLDVTGACGPLDFTASERIEKITPAGREQAFLGRYFDRRTWDGTMIFRPQGSADIVVTERVRDVFRRAKVENIEMKSLDDIEVPGDEVALWRAGVDGPSVLG